MCSTDAIVFFSLCVYLIFLRDFSAAVHSGNGGGVLLHKSVRQAVIYVISEVFFRSIHLRTICMRGLRRENFASVPFELHLSSHNIPRKSVQTALEEIR